MARGNKDVEVVSVPLASGLNESVAERMAPAGVLRDVQNYRLRDGQLVKRCGHSGTACYDAPLYVCANVGTQQGAYPSLISRVGRAPVLGTSQGLLAAYDVASDFFFFQGLHSTCKPLKQRYGMTVTTPTAGGTALSLGETPPSVAVDQRGNVMFAACDNGGTVCYVYIETAAGVRIYYDALFGSYTLARVVATGSGTFELYLQSGTSIRYYTYTVATTGSSSSASVTISSAVFPAALVSSSAHWDVDHCRSTQTTYIAYQNTATTVRVKEVIGGGSKDIAVGAGSVAGVSLSVLVGSSVTQVWVGIYDDPSGIGELHYAVYDSAVSTTVLGKTLIYAAGSAEYGPPMFGLYRQLGAGLSIPDGHTGFYVCRISKSAGYWAVGTGIATDAGGFVPAAPGHYYGASPIGKPDDYHRVWCLVGSPSSNQLLQRVALLRFQNGDAAFSDVQLSGPLFDGIPDSLTPVDHTQHRFDWTNKPAHYSFYGSGLDGYWYFAAPQVLTKVDGTAADSTLIRHQVFEYQTANEDFRQSAVPLGQSTVVGGQPTEFWGQPAGQYGASSTTVRTAAECGFLHGPTILSISTSAATGPGAGTYSYVAVYEWSDAYGRRHRSAASPPVSVTLASGNELPAVLVASMQLTQRQFVSCFVSIVLYRTQAGGTIHHRVSSLGVPATTTTPTVTISDANLDADVSLNEDLYTEGGVLDFALAPSCRFLCRSEDRVWTGGLWDPTIIQCSRQVIPGEPVEWAEDASHQVPLGQDCTGLGYMDGSVVAFTRSDVRIVTGDGPNEQGQGAFPTPRIHTSGIGCTNWRSVLETPAGILFQSGPAIYLLPRGFGAVVNVSAAVKDTLAQAFFVLAAAYAEGTPTPVDSQSAYPGRQSLARFLLSADALSYSVRILTLDLDSMQWFEDTETGRWDLGVWPMSSTTPVSDPSAPDSLAFVLAAKLDRSGTALPVKYESARAYDGSALSSGYLAGLVKTAWVSPFGYAGLFHIRKVILAYERATDTGSGASSPTSVTLSVQVDGTTAYSATFSVEQGTSVGPGVGFLELNPPAGQDVGSSFQVSIADAYVSGDAIGRGIRPMSLEVEVIREGELRQTLDGQRA